MNKVKNTFVHALRIVFLALVAGNLFSCLSIQLDKMTDEELITAGVDQWNKSRPADARPYWEHIRDLPTQEKWVAYIDDKTVLDDEVTALLALPVTPEETWAKAFLAVVAHHGKFPKELVLPSGFKPSLRAGTVEVVRSRVRAGKGDDAVAFAKTANAFLGESDAYDEILKEVKVLADIKAKEKDAGKILVKARGEEDFDESIKIYEQALAAYDSVDNAASKEIKAAALPENAPLPLFQKTIRKNRSSARVEMEKALKGRASSFAERIGEIFARTPSDDKLGNMTPEELLAFNEGIRTDINAAYEELKVFADKYPKVIDKSMVQEIQDEKAKLDTRIVEITEEIRKMQEEAARAAAESRRQKAIADEYASRGKVALPMMIGLFNPMPGNSAESKKSRPAKLKGTIKGDTEYWWGMVSIDKGAKDDLVVTMGDGKQVEVYADNPKKGDAPQNMKNLISMKDKVGRSWPVINAAKYLVNNRYYLQIKKNSSAAYDGEVVIYKSFIARMR